MIRPIKYLIPGQEAWLIGVSGSRRRRRCLVDARQGGVYRVLVDGESHIVERARVRPMRDAVTA